MAAFQGELEELVRQVLKALEQSQGENLVSFAVFGSVARGQARPGSDADLLLVFRRLPAGRSARFRVFYEALETVRERRGSLLAAAHPVDWSPLLLTESEARHHSPVYLDMVSEAKLLLDRDGFFAGVLGALAGRMRELGSRRVHLKDGSWYWDLKPDWRPGEVVDL